MQDELKPADYCRPLRKSIGWSQAKLGNALGLDQSTISDWETGKSEPRGPALILFNRLRVELLEQVK